MRRRHFVLGGVATFGGLVLSGCHHYGGAGPAYGPPPHAPAHGYRHHHPSGVTLVYDYGLGVYTVVGYPYHYYHGGNFYLWQGGVWHLSSGPRGPWRRGDGRGLPPGVRRRHAPGPHGPVRHAPPPHAPAHGHRLRRRGGPDLVYDRRLGAYTVPGRPHHYYHGDRYYRRTRDGWQSSDRLDGHWRSTSDRGLPQGLLGQYPQRRVEEPGKERRGLLSR